MKKTFVTVTGIRPDFIRMSEIFKKFDDNFNHVMVHTGQHFDTMLSDVFFNNLSIRNPDHNLHVGGEGKEHFHQTAEASVKLIELLRTLKNVDGVIFLGDSNSVASSVAVKKEGYCVIHIEAGMRSGDRRMLEEINRVVCDSVSDILFVYHENYKQKLLKENEFLRKQNEIFQIELSNYKNSNKKQVKNTKVERIQAIINILFFFKISKLMLRSYS
jgi:UDP-N-acetylglucosamine 2-epimerase (non-hydrolysing)